MISALAGTACGMLMMAALFGLVGQRVSRRAALLRGAQVAGLIGTIALLFALLAHGAQQASPAAFLNASGRALSLAGIGLVLAWLPTLRSRLLASPAESSPWWTLGIGAVLTGWAEFRMTDQALVRPAMPGVWFDTLLLLAGGLAIMACSQAIAAVWPTHTGNQLTPGTDRDHFLPWQQAAIAAVWLPLLAYSLYTFFTLGSFWPTAASFKALSAAELLFASSCFVRHPMASASLVSAGTLALVTILL